MKFRSLAIHASLVALVVGFAALVWPPGQAVADDAMAGMEAAAPAAPAPLPAYFSAANDPAKPAWPDPAGGAAGTWATPAGDGKGDTPASLATTDLYDRIAHNLFSINMMWTLVTGFLVMFMQAGFMFVETGLCAPRMRRTPRR